MKLKLITFLVVSLLILSLRELVLGGWNQTKLYELSLGFDVRIKPVTAARLNKNDELRLWFDSEMYLAQDGAWAYRKYVETGVGAFYSYFISMDDSDVSEHYYCAQDGGIYYDRRAEAGNARPQKIQGLDKGFSCDYVSAAKFQDLKYILFYNTTEKKLQFAILSRKPWEKPSLIVKTIESDDISPVGQIWVDASGDGHAVYYLIKKQKVAHATFSDNKTNIAVIADLPENANAPSLALDSNGSPHISYYILNKGLFYATRNDSGWETSNIDPIGGAGYYSAVAVSSSGVVYIAYYDILCRQFSVAQKVAGKWLVERLGPSDNDCVYGKWYFNESRQTCWVFKSWFTQSNGCLTTKIPAERNPLFLAIDKRGLPRIVYTNLRTGAVTYAAQDLVMPDMYWLRARFQKDFPVKDLDVTPPKTRLRVSRDKYYDAAKKLLFVPADSGLSFISEDSEEVPGERTSGLRTVLYSVNSELVHCFEEEYRKENMFPVMSSETWKNGGCGVGNDEGVLLSEGRYNVSYAGVDNADNYEAIVSTTINVDATPPRTILELNGKKSFANEVSVKRRAVVKLVSQDLVSNDISSGVGGIKYTLTADTQEMAMEGGEIPFSDYREPFQLAKGRHFLAFYSVDNVGNYEAVRYVTVNVN